MPKSGAMTRPRLMDASYWHERARQARARAGDMRDPSARRTLLDMAQNYEQLAEQAEARRNTHPLMRRDQ